MLFVVTPKTVLNPGALALRTVPKPLLGRGLGPIPRRTALSAAFWRLLFEHPLTRYALFLSPFLIAVLLRPDWALGLSQAPILMFLVVLFIESFVLSIPDPDRRRALIDETEAARGLDRLRLNGRAILTEIAARRGLSDGAIHLVVEQSGLARAPTATLVSVQIDGERAGFLDLDQIERGLIAERLFDQAITERRLHRINLSQNSYLRAVSLETRAVSAHARLAALAQR